jgi:hypothetical protein
MEGVTVVHGGRLRQFTRHCEERSDEAIQSSRVILDCFAALTMTAASVYPPRIGGIDT